LDITFKFPLIFIFIMVSCIECKGRYCDNFRLCPVYSKARVMFQVKSLIEKQDFFGASPAPFVGHYGYPNVSVGILTPPNVINDAWLYDAPNFWAAENYNIPEIVQFRSALVNSRFYANVRDLKKKYLDVSQEVAMASKPVEMQVNLEGKPRFSLSLDPETIPRGTSAKLKKIKITENPKISNKVEKVVDDIDLKANDAVFYLYEKGFDENFLMRMLSVGTLGMKKDRRLVPTRWSITAIDDILGKNLMTEIKDYSNYAGYLAYFGNYLGNNYLLLFFPEPWSYELFESYVSKPGFSTDYENYYGRKDYAQSTAGGYYTVRLAILEKLAELKKQGSCIALRFITDEYSVPLGVWVTREATRKALSSKPIEFSSMELMLNYAKMKIKRMFNLDISNFLEKSILLNNIKTQKKISSFIQ